MNRLVDLPDNFSQYIKNAKQNLCMAFIAVECTLLTAEGERNNSGVICDSHTMWIHGWCRCIYLWCQCKYMAWLNTLRPILTGRDFQINYPKTKIIEFLISRNVVPGCALNSQVALFW